jgi:hypothetical protein
VIEYLHQKIAEQIAADVSDKGYSEYKHFDTVRGIFAEGGPPLMAQEYKPKIIFRFVSEI